MNAAHSETYCAANVTFGEGALTRLHLEGVGAEDFAEKAPYAVVRCAEKLREQGDNVTASAVRHQMKQEDVFGEVGGAKWWSQFIGAGGDGSDLDRHIRIVKAASQLRTVDRHAGKIRKVANNGHKPREALAEVEDVTADLLEAQTRQEKNVMDGGALAEGVMDMLTSEEPQEMFLRTGFPSLDDLLDGLVVGRVNVVAARTGHGKSAWVDQLLLNVARRWDSKKVIKFDLENSETAVKSRLASNLSGVPVQDIKRHAQHKTELATPQFQKVGEAAEKMQKMPIVIDTTAAADSRYIRSRCLAEKAEEDIGLVIVDYITQMGERGDGAMEKAMNAMSGLHEISKYLDVPVVAVSQVNRKPVSGDKEPQLHHLSWSDDVAQVPAQVHMLYHPHTHWEQTDRNPGGEPDPNDLYLYTRKNKGPAGATKLRFEPDTLRIYDQKDPQPF